MPVNTTACVDGTWLAAVGRCVRGLLQQHRVAGAQKAGVHPCDFLGRNAVRWNRRSGPYRDSSDISSDKAPLRGPQATPVPVPSAAENKDQNQTRPGRIRTYDQGIMRTIARHRETTKRIGFFCVSPVLREVLGKVSQSLSVSDNRPRCVRLWGVWVQAQTQSDPAPTSRPTQPIGLSF